MFQKNETCKALKECYLMSNIPKRNPTSGCHLLKKVDQPSWRATRRNYKHIPRMHIIQIPSAALSFMGIWAIWSPLKIHCYTYMSFKTCWSRLIYTKLSSHQSFVINMNVVTMAWRCSSPWSFHRSPQRRREMDIFRYISRFPRILGKNNQKNKENLDWTLVNTENPRAEIATCQRQYYM